MTKSADQPNKIRKYFLLLFRLSPVLLLILILLYLGRSNISSEVYLDVETKTLTFSNAEDVESLITRLTVDSILFIDCDLHFRAKQVLDFTNEDISLIAGDNGISRQILVKNKGSILFKDLALTENSKIYLEAGDSYIDIQFKPPLDSTSREINYFVSGEIHVGDSFTFMGQNVQFQQLTAQNIDLKPIEVIPSRRSRNITYRSSQDAKIRLYLSKEIMKSYEYIMGDKFVNNISFITSDETKRKNKERSTILSADVEIAGTDFFGKQFLLKKHKVEENEFLLIPRKNEYYIDGLSLHDSIFRLEISCEDANDLQTGRRYNLLYSIFPSLLDFIVAEPSKKTIWTILVFVTTQVMALSGIVKKQFGKIKPSISTR